MDIRHEQLEAFQSVAEAAFEARIFDYLRAEHGDVITPANGFTTVSQSADEKLLKLIRCGVHRAREFGLTWESSLTAFVVLTFVIGPRFDEQPAIRAVLTDDEIEPDLRLDHLWDRTTEEDWEEAAHYPDPEAPANVSAVDEAAIIKRLDEGRWISRDNIAREIVGELTPEQIRMLSPATRARLQQELRSGYVSDADRQASEKITAAEMTDQDGATA